MKCRWLQEHVDAYLDGEATPSAHIVFENHLLKCDGCRDVVEAFITQRQCIKRVYSDAGMSPQVRERLHQSFLQNASSLDLERSEDTPLIRFVPLRLKHVIPAAALGIALFSVFRYGDSGSTNEASAGSLGLFGEVQRLHAHHLPMDIQDAEALPTYFSDKVPVPVYPVSFGNATVRFSGARYAQIAQKPVATLYYLSGQRRITVVVSESYPEAWRQGQLVRLRGRDIYTYRVAGRTISAFEESGVLYTFAGDLPPRQMLHLAASMQVR